MKETYRISQLTLELYYLDAVTVKERKLVETALASDKELRTRYEALQKSDQELRPLFAAELQRLFSLDSASNSVNLRDAVVPVSGADRFSHNRKTILGLAAAAILLLVLVPFLFYFRGHRSSKGNELDHVPEATIYNVEEEEEQAITEPAIIIVDGGSSSGGEINPEIDTGSFPDTTEETGLGMDANDGGVVIAGIPEQDTGTHYRGGTPVEQQSNINIPEGLTFIFDGMFAGKQLGYVIIPNRITSIGKNAFADNPLISVTIGTNVRIEDNAIPGNFAGAYNRYGKAAGTYTRSNVSSNEWVKQ
ncbi:MAG: leucine-rich repeat domain-containing protein [Treponema sp.]|nr:leucine-rich repeat domain-containing protein [Treponema sp.]